MDILLILIQLKNYTYPDTLSLVQGFQPNIGSYFYNIMVIHSIT